MWRTPLQNNKTTQNSVGIRKRGSVGMEQMRRMVRSVDEMVRLRRERKIDGLYRNATK